MNRLAAETTSEQVNRAMSDAQCLTNDTADYDDGLLTDDRSSRGGGGGGKNEKAGTSPSQDLLQGGGPPTDGTTRVIDESKLTKVSALNEDTCPGKERPLVDGTPDAAQNSDRVLWESTNSSSSATDRPRRSPAPLTLQLLSLLSVLASAVYSRHRC